VIDAVATLWAENRPLSEIAEAVGVSRSVVAGAIHRARRNGDRRFPSRPNPTPKPSASKDRKVKPSAPVAEASVKPVRFVDLRPGRCHWPINDAPRGQTNLFLFCGASVATRGESYCPRHAELTRARHGL